MSNSQSKNNSFERRLAGYALAAGTAFVGAGQADAGIVYSGPLDVNILPTNPGAVQNFDFDGDTNIDFRIGNFTDNPPTIVEGLFYSSAGYVGEDLGASLPFATPLGYGDLISSSNVGTKSIGKLTFDSVPPSIPGLPWVPGVDAYIGIAFTIGTDVHYGWVETAVGTDYSLTVKGWAYNDVADAGINAGVVPEPSSLALLAAGAAGVVAFAARKRRAVVSAS